MFDLYAGILLMNSTFMTDSAAVALRVDFSAPELVTLREQYHLDAIAGAGTTMERATRLLRWLADGCYHNGSVRPPEPSDAPTLLAFSYGQGEEKGINCWALSVTLTECLLAVGIAARFISIIPCSPYDVDNHVVVHVWLPEEARWVMMDPTFGAYAMDDHGRALDLFALRDALAHQRPIHFNADMHYNGKPYAPNEYRDYLAKDLYWFQTMPISRYHAAMEQTPLYCCPLGYQPLLRDLECAEHGIRTTGEQPWLLAWRDAIRKAILENKPLAFVTPDALLQPPISDGSCTTKE